MLDELAEILGRRFDGYALMEVKKTSYQVRFSGNRITVVKRWKQDSLDIMVDKDAKVYVTGISLPTEKDATSIAELAERAIQNAKPKQDYQPLPEPGEVGRHPVHDSELVRNPERLVELAEEAVASGVEAGAKRMAGTVYAEHVRYRLVTSAGADFSAEDTSVYIDVRAFVSKRDTGHASAAGRFLSDIDPKSVAERAVEFATMSTEKVNAEPGKYRALFTPDAFATILNNIGMAASAFYVESGFSFFAGKIGESVASEKLTVIDAPRTERGYVVRTFDDEGVATSNKEVISGGVLRTYLHNRFTAKKFGASLTGNSGWILPHAWQLEVLPGDARRDELLEVLGDGVLVGNVTYLRFQNYVNGDFSAVIRDGVFLVKGGEVVGRLINFRLSDNMLSLLKGVEELSRERVQLYHWWLEEKIPVVSPWVLVSEAGFTKAFG